MLEQEPAENIAIQALGWIAGSEELLPQFLASTGATAGDLRQAAAKPEFLGAVLDFLLMDDAWVMGFCDSVGLRYEVPMQARAGLPGGPGPHWT